MREQVFELIRHYGIEESMVKERYLLEIIDEVHPMLHAKNPSEAASFYQKSHEILQKIELHAAGQGKLLPGVEGTLKTLRQRGMKIGIITRNCEEAVRKVFPDINAYCDVFLSRDSIERVKPHPDHLLSALRALGVTGEEAVMVGDHLIDVQAGKKAGMKTIGVLTGRIRREEFKEAGTDAILGEVSEIGRFLEPGGE
jgi:phosphoglycolate phosphatase